MYKVKIEYTDNDYWVSDRKYDTIGDVWRWVLNTGLRGIPPIKNISVVEVLIDYDLAVTYLDGKTEFVAGFASRDAVWNAVVNGNCYLTGAVKLEVIERESNIEH